MKHRVRPEEQDDLPRPRLRVLHISVEGRSRGGREQLSALLEEGLRDVAGEDLISVTLSRGGTSPKISERLVGRVDGITSEVERDLLGRLSQSLPDCVVIDGSNLGRLARLIKRARPALSVITFYHNVEARFFFDSLRASPSIRAAGVLVANAIAERWATRHSDYRLTLNARDSKTLGSIYGRRGTDVLPMSLRDQYDPRASAAPRPFSEPYALFVGGSFYANVEGIAWYARKVAQHAPMPTIVIGRGMEPHRARLENWGGIRVVGEIDDLGPWYAHAQIVVAPILSGSGMKTKTAEALMYGKQIAGTPEAFAGYTIKNEPDLRLCRRPSDFLDALDAAARSGPEYRPNLRRLYESQHSEASFKAGLVGILSRVAKIRNL